MGKAREAQNPDRRLGEQVNIADPRRTKSVDWTNILKSPFRSTLTRTDPNGTESTFPRFVRFDEATVSAGIRFRF
ncbi:MAG TPA: hypothetical protein VF759_03860 [Allosphingosinicella sp.]|jgi:hypothetical protein